MSIPSYNPAYAGEKPIRPATDLKISLAQWSMHRALQNGEQRATDFASIAGKEYGITAIEYVNQFYINEAHNQKFWSEMKRKAEDEGVQSLLIMVDGEGDLGHKNERKRKKAVENHYKWIHAAKLLDCHSVRVNAFGKGSREALRTALINSLGQLAEYGGKEQIHILIENHGLHTSDGTFMAGIIREVDHPYLGTLPDFGNWCLNAEWGSIKDNSCTEMYDPYQGLADFLPFAKGVSAKSYDFDPRGNESTLDYLKMLQLVKNSGFKGYIGIEYEGDTLSEAEGIRATKRLIEKTLEKLE